MLFSNWWCTLALWKTKDDVTKWLWWLIFTDNYWHLLTITDIYRLLLTCANNELDKIHTGGWQKITMSHCPHWHQWKSQIKYLTARIPRGERSKTYCICRICNTNQKRTLEVSQNFELYLIMIDRKIVDRVTDSTIAYCKIMFLFFSVHFSDSDNINCNKQLTSIKILLLD